MANPMLRISIRSLVYDRGKLIAAIGGVAFAATLALVQNGLFHGFLYTSSAMISRMGGDVWVMARGTEVLDSVENLSAATESLVRSHPCVHRARPLIFTWSFVRKGEKNTRDPVRIVGVRPKDRPYIPWSMETGLPSDIAGPMRVAIDAFDLKKLQIKGKPIGQELNVYGLSARIAALTKDVRSFTLLPFIFASLDDARRFTGLSDGEVNYWVLDLKDKACTSSVIAHVEQHPELEAKTTSTFIKQSQDYWIIGSGVGAVLAFSALLALIIGGVIVGQTLFSITKDYQNELATLKAIGASRLEMIGFIGWQALFLALAGGVIGTLAAFGVGKLAAKAGLLVLFPPSVILSSWAIIFSMCAIASLLSIRRVLSLDAAEVFK